MAVLDRTQNIMEHVAALHEALKNLESMLGPLATAAADQAAASAAGNGGNSGMRPSFDVPMAAAMSVDPFVSRDIHEMDPRLQLMVARKRRGEFIAPTASSLADEVPVIARVTDVKKWEALSEVRIGATIGDKGEGGDTIVTGRIPASRIVAVRQQPFVLSLKAAQELRPQLHATIAETAARVDLLPTGHLANGGAGVVVGIIDYGCDFAHRNFLKADGTTRLLSLWHQDGAASASSPFGYGRVYTPTQINAALAASDPYVTMGYGPTPDHLMLVPGTHGTHVMDIAAGNGNGSGTPGVAPLADLVFVDVSHADIPFSGKAVVEKSFGDSTRLLEACKYVFEFAGTRPCVINISLGTNGGPHDGTTLVEDGLDRLLSQQSNRAVVIAASNSFDDGIHAAGKVADGETFDLAWQVAGNDSSQNEFELWYAGSDRFDVEVIAPDGTSVGRVAPGETLPLEINNRLAMFISSRLNDPNNHDNVIGIFMEARFSGWSPAGTWTLRLHGTQVVDGSFHAWIERDNAMPSRFAPPHDNTHTLGSISCGKLSLAVGSYDAHKASLPLSFFSSEGPTRDGRQKPEISAPGHAVFAAHSRTKTQTIAKNGTSMASPAVAGVCALVFAEAAARGANVSIAQLRKIVADIARRNPPSGTSWHARYGAGRISAAEAVKQVMGNGGLPPSGPSAPQSPPPGPGGSSPVRKPTKKTKRKAPKKSAKAKKPVAKKKSPRKKPGKKAASKKSSLKKRARKKQPRKR